jgi:putative ATPase
MQQDIFLSHCENGLITLVGATTENPSYSINSALLSRCRVFVFEKLKKAHIISILINACKTINVDIVSNNNHVPNPNAK